MKLFLSTFLLLMPVLSFADCEKFLATKIQEMNFGKSNDLRCGVLKNDTKEKLRISMSTKKGRKDLGPTLSFDKRDSSNLVLTQLFSKNKLTKHKHRMKISMSENCNKYNTVTYTLGTLQSEVNQKRCDNYPDSFSQDELVYLAVGKICDNYFPEQSVTIIQNAETTNEVISTTKE